MQLVLVVLFVFTVAVDWACTCWGAGAHVSWGTSAGWVAGAVFVTVALVRWGPLDRISSILACRIQSDNDARLLC